MQSEKISNETKLIATKTTTKQNQCSMKETTRMHAKLTPHTRQKPNQSPIESNSIESHGTKPSVFQHLCNPSRQEPICELNHGSRIRLIKITHK